MDYKISKHTWVPFEDDCAACLTPCHLQELTGQVKVHCIPNCTVCEFFGAGNPCADCSALSKPKIPGRVYFQPRRLTNVHNKSRRRMGN